MRVEIVGIDGGKSGMRLRGLSAGAHVEARRQGFVYGPDGDAERLADEIVAIIDEAGIEQASSTCLALTAMPGEAGEQRDLLAIVGGRTGGRVVLTGDVVAAHAGAIGRPGVVATIGTGTTVLAISPEGSVACADGWGPLIGDRGSAHDVGLAGLRGAAGALDGTGPDTLLVEAMRKHLGGTDLAALQRFYRRVDLTTHVAAFASEVTAAAIAGDGVALSVCRRAADDLAATIMATADRVAPAGDDLVVAVVGAMAGVEPIAGPLADALAAQRLVVVPPQGDGVAGALALAGGGLALYADLLEAEWMPVS